VQKTKSTPREIYLNDIAQNVSIEKTFTLIVAFVIRNEDGVIVQRKLLVLSAHERRRRPRRQPFPLQLRDDARHSLCFDDLSGFLIVPLSFRESPS
jgi:hypothetical protein